MSSEPEEIGSKDLKNTRPKQFVFVLMPFAKEFDDTYELGIRAACHAAGAYCERVDEQIFEGSILDRVYHQISTADLIIADMSGRNPNVFYEVGYAHALGKRVILLTRVADDIPFDLKHYQHIVYGDSITGLRDRLEPVVRYYINEPKTQGADPFHLVQFYLNRQEIIPESSVVLRYSDFGGSFVLSALNASNRVVELGNPITLTLLPSPQVWFSYVDPSEAILDPSGRNICRLPLIGTLFPGQWWSTTVYPRATVSLEFDLPIVIDCILTQYGPIGSHQIDFKLEYD